MTHIPSPFECVLLNRMSESYRSEVLNYAGISSEVAHRNAATSKQKYPFEWGQPIADYERDLAMQAERHTVVRGEGEFSDLMRFDYPLDFWPNMFWAVQCAAGRTRVGGFLSRALVGAQSFDLAELKPGELCLADLERLGLDWSLIDGWSEKIVARFDTPSASFEGEFVFGLLQSWRALT